MSVIQRRKHQFCRKVLGENNKIGFVDVGSGGPLKEPWSFIAPECLAKFEIEPTAAGDGNLPLCISNRIGPSKFFVAHDERGSSLHEPSADFAQRFGQESILTKKTIDVSLTTLDELFLARKHEVDALDVNTEGHDFQVLQGGGQLLDTGRIKLIKVEFELTEVWKEQGWFSDIDAYLRSKLYDMANIELDYAKPRNARDINHRGEPLWGKAYYVPSLKLWDRWQGQGDLSADFRKAIVLDALADMPGRAFDLCQWGRQQNGLQDLNL
ncbi:MAG: FkbM family methyltransferase, partial [Candidatus Omnitrophica bacterium]|nr:FkbM family methyltransferase [Candidatus Omnitrophota bacterium]